MNEIEIEIIELVKNNLKVDQYFFLEKSEVDSIFNEIKARYEIGIGNINWSESNLICKLGDNLNNFEKLILIGQVFEYYFCQKLNLKNEDIIIMADDVLEIGIRMKFYSFIDHINIFIPLPYNLIILLPDNKIINYTWFDELFYG